MRVLLVQAPLGRTQTPVYPLGLVTIAAGIGDHHETQVLDANCCTRDEIEDRIDRFRPEVIGLGLRNIDTTQSHDPFSYFRPLPGFVSWLRELADEATFVVGGPGFSMFPREVMEAIPQFDLGVEREGELVLRALLHSLGAPESVPGLYYRDRSQLVYTGSAPLPDISDPPFPHRFLDPSPYQDEAFQLGIQSKRGCAHRCLYCNYPYLNGRRLRLRNPDRVVDELEQLSKEHGIRRFAFADAIFNEPREHAAQICRALARRKLGLTWTAYFTMRGFDRPFLELAAEAGCELFEFSPDGLSQATLDALQKEINEEQIEEVLGLFENASHPRFGLQLMFNGPRARIRDFLLLARAALLWPRKYRALEFVAITNMRIYPETPLFRLAVEERVVDPDQSLLLPVFYNPWPLRPVSWVIHLGGRLRRRIMKWRGLYRF